MPSIVTQCLIATTDVLAVAADSEPALMMAWLEQAWVRWPLTIAYLFVLAIVSMYGIHRYWLVWMYRKHRRSINDMAAPPLPGDKAAWPRVTVQLPLYNESRVAERIIDAACRLDWPADRLQIQVLDDSTDDTTDISAARVAHWKGKGVDISMRHRDNRSGYKAGALEEGLAEASGEFIAIFDADFVPEADFLKRLMPWLQDDAIGCVQARWDHLNRDDSLLTRAQAVFLDGHFLIEHTARHLAGRWFNFNGTAGIWRRQAIDDAGGWQHDTLTEDVDLSYRAQLAGWGFKYLPHVGCPAELPPEINAFKSQQHRWAKGSIQTARKLLGRILRADLPLGIKTEAFFHLTGPMVYLCMTIMALLFYPALYVNMQPYLNGAASAALVGLSLFAMGTVSAGVFYVVSQRARGYGWLRSIGFIPVLMCVGIGVALNNARGVLEAIFGVRSGFVRTPKYNAGGSQPSAPRPTPQTRQAEPKLVLPTPSIKLWMAMLELALGLYVLHCARLSYTLKHNYFSVPFLLLFAVGYLYVGGSSLWSKGAAWRRQGEATVVPNSLA